jgi:hypothetical protein
MTSPGINRRIGALLPRLEPAMPVIGFLNALRRAHDAIIVGQLTSRF